MKWFLPGVSEARDVLDFRSRIRSFTAKLNHIRALQQGARDRGSAAFEQALLADPRYGEPGRLNRHEAQVFSQNGEDGILTEIFRRIGTSSRRFVEMGVGDGLESNTAYLLLLGWEGTWLDADQAALARARENFSTAIVEGRLVLASAFITAENAPRLLEERGVPEELDLLSVDVDRNTSHVWRALRKFRPRVVVVEYNASILPQHAWEVPYKADMAWNGTIHFGASLKAFEALGAELGYNLVACETHGINAFFVRADLVAERFCAPFSAENHYEPPRYWLMRRTGHARGFSD